MIYGEQAGNILVFGMKSPFLFNQDSFQREGQHEPSLPPGSHATHHQVSEYLQRILKASLNEQVSHLIGPQREWGSLARILKKQNMINIAAPTALI